MVRVGADLKDHLVPNPHETRLLKAPSNLALNTARDGASTTTLGNLCQCLTTLIVKNFFLVCNLNNEGSQFHWAWQHFHPSAKYIRECKNNTIILQMGIISWNTLILSFDRTDNSYTLFIITYVPRYSIFLIYTSNLVRLCGYITEWKRKWCKMIQLLLNVTLYLLILDYSKNCYFHCVFLLTCLKTFFFFIMENRTHVCLKKKHLLIYVTFSFLFLLH